MKYLFFRKIAYAVDPLHERFYSNDGQIALFSDSFLKLLHRPVATTGILEFWRIGKVAK